MTVGGMGMRHFRRSSLLRIESGVYFGDVNLFEVEENIQEATSKETRQARPTCKIMRKDWRVLFED